MNTRERSGQNFICPVCGKTFYRSPAQIAGSGKTAKACSKACQSVLYSGKGNPFWGQTHTPNTREKMSAGKKGKASPKKGLPGPKASLETRKKQSDALKLRWQNHRETMISYIPKGDKSPFYKGPEFRRYRKNFTPRQRREWTSTECAYCGTKDNLVLDHIIPIFDGGGNHQSNSQTLCQTCNLWKTKHVDMPRYYAALATKGADIVDPL